MARTTLHLAAAPDGEVFATITVGTDGPLAFFFGSGRHPDEQAPIRIPDSEGKIRSRVGVVAIEPDGLGIGRTPEAMDHQLIIRRPDVRLPEVLAASPGRRMAVANYIERKFLDDEAMVEIVFPPHRFHLNIVVVNAPWQHLSRPLRVRPYTTIEDPQVALLIMAIVEPTLAGGNPRVANNELAVALGWSARKVSSVGSRAHDHLFDNPAVGDKNRLATVAAHVLNNGFVTDEDIRSTLHVYQESKGLRSGPEAAP